MVEGGAVSESAVTDQPSRMAMVDYLMLEPEPHLVANQCTSCGARYFDRRNACAACFDTDFEKVTVPTEGEVASFTIVAFASPGVEVPFVAAVVDCGGTSVRANLVNVPADDDHVKLGMKVRLTTFSMGVDSNGVEGVGFGFEPA